MFQGTRVAIKKVTIKKKLDINNQLLWEIKQVCQIFNYIFFKIYEKLYEVPRTE
jgi:hypothetical protein